VICIKFFYNSRFGQLEFEVFDGVYFPDEDSLLLAGVLEKFRKMFVGKKILEMGCGCGFLSVLLSKLTKSEIVAVDINKEAVENTNLNARKNHAKVLAKQSDLFCNIEEKFDFIIFNPPYLPVSDEIEGGEWWSMLCKNGNIIERFVKESKIHLNKNGNAILLYSSLSGDVQSILKKNGFVSKIVGKKKLDWEELRVVRYHQ